MNDLTHVDEVIDLRSVTEPTPVLAPEAEEKILSAPNRSSVRALILTTDSLALHEGSASEQWFQELGGIFEELHVIVLSTEQHDFKARQIAEHAWVYPTNSSSALMFVYDAYRVAAGELSIAGGFRPDIVCALDPFSAGIAAYAIARRFSRPYYLEVTEDIYDPHFKEQSGHGRFALRLAGFVVKNAARIRVVTEALKSKIENRYPHLKDHIDVLMYIEGLEGVSDHAVTVDLRKKYPQFNFIILAATPLVPGSNLPVLIDACEHVLRTYPTIGLVIVGAGSEEKTARKKLTEMGLGDKVVFESKAEDIFSYYKTCQVFINVSTREDSARSAIEAAAAKTAVITTPIGTAEKLFENEKSGFVCAATDLVCFVEALNKYLNNEAMRVEFAENAAHRARILFSAHKQNYFNAFTASIEQALRNTLSENEPPAA